MNRERGAIMKKVNTRSLSFYAEGNDTFILMFPNGDGTHCAKKCFSKEDRFKSLREMEEFSKKYGRKFVGSRKLFFKVIGKSI